MDTTSTTIEDVELHVIECDVCGRQLHHKLEELVELMLTAWPCCCGRQMMVVPADKFMDCVRNSPR